MSRATTTVGYHVNLVVLNVHESNRPARCRTHSLSNTVDIVRCNRSICRTLLCGIHHREISEKRATDIHHTDHENHHENNADGKFHQTLPALMLPFSICLYSVWLISMKHLSPFPAATFALLFRLRHPASALLHVHIHHNRTARFERYRKRRDLNTRPDRKGLIGACHTNHNLTAKRDANWIG
jgi:hypothetical protein